MNTIRFYSAIAAQVFLVSSLMASLALAQTEKAPVASPTDEYGIPLKLESPKKVQNSTPISAAQSSPDAPAMATTTTSSKTTTKSTGKLARLKAKPRKSKSAAPQVVAPEVLENQATKELLLPKEDLSTGVLPTPATVRSHVEEVRNPVRPLAYRLGVSLQPFSPKGTMPVGDLTPYDLSQVGTNAMIAVEGQWLPLTIMNVPGLQAGAFASLGYAQFNVSLRSPAGISLDDTKLHIVKVQFGGTASYQLPRSPLWSLHGNLGLGRLMEIQSSGASSYANASETVDFASLGLNAERSLLPTLSVYAGYDFRLALSRSTVGADVPNHSVLLGFFGNFE